MSGIMWYVEEDGWRGVERAIHQAALRYEERTNRKAVLAYAHPALMPGVGEAVKVMVGGIEVRSGMSLLLPHHIWVGEGDFNG